MNLPNKKFDIIYADPPWSYRDSSGGDAKSHYNTLSITEISTLPIRDICHDKTVLFMWATFPNLPEALEVMTAWGFTYKTVAFVWVKQNKNSEGIFMGPGSYTRTNAEICLLGVSKNTQAKDFVKSHSVRQIVISPLREHSRKPDEVRDRIKELIGNDKSCIELFARESTEGWDVWGNETTKFTIKQKSLW